MRSIFRIPALHPLAFFASLNGKMGTDVDKVRRKHAKMLVKKLNISGVDSLCNLLSDLVRASTLNHVESGPAILGLSAG